MADTADDSLTFGAVVELAVAMPLSWLPLISDYTREAKEPVKATAVSAVVYGIVSCFMYLIGMGASIFTENEWGRGKLARYTSPWIYFAIKRTPKVPGPQWLEITPPA